jgi:hypothetical protein
VSWAESNISTIRDSLLLPTTGADPIITSEEATKIVPLSDDPTEGEPDLRFPEPINMAAAAIDISKDVD